MMSDPPTKIEPVHHLQKGDKAMAVFYSFHYDRDNWRVQQIINMGVVEGQPILNSQDWETVRRQGDKAIQNWIDDQMKRKQAVVVLIGAQTASRPWVKYEIGKAWEERKPLVGVRIHGLKDRDGHTDSRGVDPLAAISARIPVHDPSGTDSQAVYNSINKNLAAWVAGAYKRPL
jgi:hypothetical protein